MPLKIVRNDITKMHVDAIVNTANAEPIYSSGVDMAIYQAAGEDKLLAARREIGHLEEGEVAVTPGFGLPAKYIIHAVSPYYENGEKGEETLLRLCYQRSLEEAFKYHCESIAFPLISTGSFGYPKEEGIRIAVDEITGFLLHHSMLVYLVVFDDVSTRLSKQFYPALEEYIDHNYVEVKSREEYSKPRFAMRNVFAKAAVTCREEVCDTAANTLADYIEEENYCDFLEENESALQERMKHMSDTFQEYLMYLIEARGLNNSEVYKRAIITKQLFSKIKLNPGYHPDKGTAMRLCVGAKLNLDETKDLLARAGYALSPCDKRDIIFSFFIEHGVFDMIEIDIALEEHGLPCFIE